MADFSALKTAIQANIRTNANEEITGAILQEILLSMVTTMGDGAINGLVTALQEEVVARQNAVGGEATARQDADSALSGRINGEATARQDADSALSGRINGEATARQDADTLLQNAINGINTKLAEGYIYAGIATPSTNPSTPTGKVFYIALQGGTYTNFSGLTVTQGINILKYNGSAWSLEQLWGVDDVPTAGSDNMVKSGGVYSLLATVPFYIKENDIFNPNNGYEGLNMPPSPSFGDNAVVFNVKGNTKYTLSGGEFGFVMEFSQLSTTPPTGISTSYFIAKVNAREANTISFTTNSNTTILAVNNFGDYSKIILRSGDNVVTFNDFTPTANEAHSASVAVNVSVGDYIETPRNPNPGYEGLVLPPDQTNGIGSISFNVSKFRGKEIFVSGNQLGYIMQFGESIDPSNFIEKVNAYKNTKFSLIVNQNTTYLTTNVFTHDEETIVRGNNSVAYIDDINYLNSKNNTLICIGDSITQGRGASTYAYNFYWRLRTQLIRDNIVFNSFNFGSGGAGSTSIAAYCGASYLEIIEDVTIPQSGSINISLNTNVQDAAGGVTYCNPCYLGGIKGTLAYSSGQYSFTRVESGDTKFVASGSPLITMAAKENVNGYILTIFVGTNDNTDTYTDREQALIDNIVSISKLSKNNKFIIIQPYVHSTSSTLRTKLKELFGDKYIDLYNYMVNMSVYDAIEQGLLPSSSEQSEWNSLLTIDGTHPNDIGHNLIYQQIYGRIKELDY